MVIPASFCARQKVFICPNCQNHDSAKVSVICHVCGYLGSLNASPFNKGKQEEVKRRVKHLSNGSMDEEIEEETLIAALHMNMQSVIPNETVDIQRVSSKTLAMLAD